MGMYVARIRSIHPGLTTDEAYMTMTMACKAAWPLMWTECDDRGIFEWKPIVLKARIFPADDVNFVEILAEMERLGCVRRYEIDGKSFGAVKNFCQYQRPKHPSYRYPTTGVDLDFIAFKEVDLVNPPPALPPPSQRATENPPQMEDGEKDEEDKRDTDVSLPAAIAPFVVIKIERDRIKRAEIRARQELLGTDWNIFAAEYGLQQIGVIEPGSKRDRSTLAFVKSERDMAAVFTKIRASPFLLGQLGGTFRVNLDWIMKPDNFNKIIEGNYDEIPKNQLKPQQFYGAQR